ncbi:MAG: type II toxin-antitoxin system VapC family toxin [Pseudonocardiaceae bacterium]
MRLLLDTHAIIWWLEQSPRLSAAAQSAITDSSNDVFVSAVSALEMSLKSARGKLRAPSDLDELIVANAFVELPITVRHGIALRHVPHHHKDPFDRLLVAQAHVEGLTLVTADRELGAYGVPILPAS